MSSKTFFHCMSVYIKLNPQTTSSNLIHNKHIHNHYNNMYSILIQFIIWLISDNWSDISQKKWILEYIALHLESQI